jgi:hypothetical protein
LVRHRAGVVEQRHALAQRRMPAFRDEGKVAAGGDGRCQRQGIGDDAALGVAGGGELGRLGHVLAEHQFRRDRLPQAAVAQRFLGPHAVGRMLRIGDGEAGDPPRGKCSGKIGEVFVGFELRAVGCEDDDAPKRVEGSFVAGESVPMKIEHEAFVGREIRLVGRALADLAGEVAGRAEGQLD